ncbi:MAG: hypothetical protein GY855_06560, partial [candidate division Zixibacteria bacterium]|nr:hypothetical protein [candidate division Zixibacteria bacterium]
MIRNTIIFIILFTIFSTPVMAEEDILGKALDEIGFTRDDLGYQPKGYWNRYPNPELIPYKMPHFDDLFAEPLMGYQFTVSMGNVIEDYLNPEFMAEKRFSLHRIVYLLGVDRRIGGFRNYSVNLHAEIDSTRPMIDAIEQIYAYKHKQMTYYAFGNKVEWPDLKKDAEDQLVYIHNSIQIEIAKILLNILDAARWRDLALRNVPKELVYEILEIDNLGETQGDGTIYHHQFDDVAKMIDEQSLYYGCMKAVQAAESGKWGLTDLFEDKYLNFSNVKFDLDTPLGRIAIGGTKNDKYGNDDYCLIVDFGGNDTYNGAIGGTPGVNTPVSICIDFEGNDKYINEEKSLASQGAGIFGCGVLIDIKGKDKYESKTLSQGCGIFGMGLLLDEEGDDEYKMESSGQGCGYFGCGF